MLTQEPQVLTRAPAQPRSRMWVLALVAIAAAIAGAFWLFGDDAVPASEAEPMITFDGQTATYEGPAVIENDGAVAFEFTNDSSEMATLMVWLYPSQEALDEHLADFEVGTSIVPAGPGPIGATGIIASMTLDAGQGPDTLNASLPTGYFSIHVGTIEGISASLPTMVWQLGGLELIDEVID